MTINISFIDSGGFDSLYTRPWPILGADIISPQTADKTIELLALVLLMIPFASILSVKLRKTISCMSS